MVTAAGRLGLRLPPGWVEVAPVEGQPVAVLPDGEAVAGVITVVRTSPAGPEPVNPGPCAAGSVEAGPSEAGSVEALVRAVPGLLVVDASPETCGDSTPARRLLFSHVADGRGVTTELWLVGGPRPATLCATVDTGRYAQLRPRLHRALRGYRG